MSEPMGTADFLARAVEITDNCIEILRSKNADYANDDDAFQNFRLCETIAGIPTEIGILVRSTDKLQRIGNLLRRDPAVQGETIYDSIDDLINYLIILRVQLKQVRGE